MINVDRQLHLEILTQIFNLTQLQQQLGPSGIESHIDCPNESTIFIDGSQFLLQNDRVKKFIFETYFLILSTDIKASQLDRLLTKDIESDTQNINVTILNMIKAQLVAAQEQLAPFAAAEYGRRTLPLEVRPSYEDLDRECSRITKALNLKINGVRPALQNTTLEESRLKIKSGKKSVDSIILESPQTVQKLLSEIKNLDLVNALADAEDTTLAFILSFLSDNAAEMIWDDICSVRKNKDLEQIEKSKQIFIRCF